MRWFRMPSILALLLAVPLVIAHPMPSTASATPLLFEVQSLITSYYSPKFEGDRTASGQRHDSEALMAAHRTLPFGTILRVTNLRNGRDVIVRVNDRGPFSPRLGLDISQAAAREINMIRAGIAKVQVEVVGDAKGRPLLDDEKFFVDMGTVSGAQSEARLLSQVNEATAKLAVGKAAAGKAVKTTPVDIHVKAMPDNRGRRFVGIGPFRTFSEAEQQFKAIKPHLPRARVICASTGKQSARLVASVVADDVPSVVSGYKGKAQKPKKSVKSKTTRKSKATSVNKSSGAKATSAVKKTSTKAPAKKNTNTKSKAAPKTKKTSSFTPQKTTGSTSSLSASTAGVAGRIVADRL